YLRGLLDGLLEVRPDLVFAASTGLVRGDDFIRPEKGRGAHLFVLRELRSDLLQIALAETHAAYLDLAVRRDQKNGRHVGQPVGIGRGITIAVYQRQERH